jgi:hypothetical protein
VAEEPEETATVRLAVDVSAELAGRLQDLAKEAAIERGVGRLNRMDVHRELLAAALEDDAIRRRVIAGVPTPPPRKRRTAEELRQDS